MGTKTYKVAIIGAESTGKTALAEALALRYNTIWVPEYARTYLEKLNRPYTRLDVEDIARGQIHLEEAALEQRPSMLFCDTNLLVIKIWMDHAYGFTPEWILDAIRQRQYHLHILTDWQIPYEPDPLREHPEMRDYFTVKYRQEIEQSKVPFLYVKGSLHERLQQVSDFLKIDK
ncbi:MAG: ATP-binding protein [Chitinophagales bacterium]|nr:ATP-binding protein [Chitinophagales bacterium]